MRKRRQRRQKSKEERRKSRFWVRDIFLKKKVWENTIRFSLKSSAIFFQITLVFVRLRKSFNDLSYKIGYLSTAIARSFSLVDIISVQENSKLQFGCYFHENGKDASQISHETSKIEDINPRTIGCDKKMRQENEKVFNL